MAKTKREIVLERVPLQFHLNPDGFSDSTSPTETHVIRKDGDQWCLYTSDGSKKLGCHDSKEGALAQERAIKAQEAQAKDSSVESGRFSGIASVFGSVVDTFPNRTKFRRGAFLKTINERGHRVKILSQHDDRSTWIGLPTKLQETKEGLYVEASLNKTSLGLDAAEALRHAASLGKLDCAEMSIGFDALNCDMVEDEEDKEVFREITEARLFEISLVNFGADTQTSIIEAANLDLGLLPRNNQESFFDWTLRTLKALREGAAPFKEQAPLNEAQRKQLMEELALHIPAGSPSSALTEYERQRKLTEIEIAEAEAAFALLAI